MKWIIRAFSCMAIAVIAGMIKPGLFRQPAHFPKPYYTLEKNSVSKEKVLLGRALFYDPILSADSTISCESCHMPYTAFAHTDHALSHGIKDLVGKRNALALMNLAWEAHFMWDGSIKHLDFQSLAPIENPLEMGEKLQQVVSKLQRNERYKKQFKKAWGTEEIDGEKVLKSLSAFMLTLISDQSKYDLVLLGKASFTAQELSGYALFKQHCNTCHTEPLFNHSSFKNNGLIPDSILQDGGRIKVTKKAEDSLKFKVPTLRNIEYSYPYMHDGRFNTLREVLNHYGNGPFNHLVDDKNLMQPLQLSDKEKTDLIAFLKTLTDPQFIFNQKNGYPKDFFSK